MTRSTSSLGQVPAASASIPLLPDRWAASALEVEPYNPGAAYALRRCAAELKAALEASVDEVLTLADAAMLSGYSTDHLARLIREGRLPNAGRAHAPRLRRADVPCRASRLSPRAPTPMLPASRRQIAEAVVNSSHGGPDD